MEEVSCDCMLDGGTKSAFPIFCLVAYAAMSAVRAARSMSMGMCTSPPAILIGFFRSLSRLLNSVVIFFLFVGLICSPAICVMTCSTVVVSMMSVSGMSVCPKNVGLWNDCVMLSSCVRIPSRSTSDVNGRIMRLFTISMNAFMMSLLLLEQVAFCVSVMVIGCGSFIVRILIVCLSK